MKPILFDLGRFQLHSFGLMVALGFLCGTWLAARRARVAGLDPAAIQDIVFPWLLVGGLLGARILYVVSYWDHDFAGKPWTDAFAIWKGGLVFYGGLIGAVIAGVIGIRRRGLPLWRTADALTPGLALGHVFGRLGCLLNGCCFGRTCTLPWAIHFPDSHETHGAGLHPTQVYEALLNLALCAALVWWHDRRRRFDGQVFALYLLAYAVIRSVCEVFRGDYAYLGTPKSALFTPGQSTSLLIFAAGVVAWLFLSRRRTAAVPTTPHP